MLEQQTNPSGPHPVSQSRTSGQTGPGIKAETLIDKNTIMVSICRVLNDISEMSPGIERDSVFALNESISGERGYSLGERSPHAYMHS